MPGLTITGTIGGKKVAGGRRRLPGGPVEVMDRKTGEWKRGMSGWQERDLKADLGRRRSLDGRLEALAQVEDPDVLDRLEKGGSQVVKDAVKVRRNKGGGKPSKG